MLYFLPFSGNLVLYCFERIRELALTRAFRSVSCYIVLNVWSMYSARSLTGFTVRESILLDRMHNASAVCKWLMNHVFRCLSETDSALRRFVFFLLQTSICSTINCNVVLLCCIPIIAAEMFGTCDNNICNDDDDNNDDDDGGDDGDRFYLCAYTPTYAMMIVCMYMHVFRHAYMHVFRHACVYTHVILHDTHLHVYAASRVCTHMLYAPFNGCSPTRSTCNSYCPRHM